MMLHATLHTVLHMIMHGVTWSKSESAKGIMEMV